MEAVFLSTDPDGPPEAESDDDPALVPPSGREVIASASIQVNATFITVDDVLQRKRAEFQALPAGLDEAGFRQQAQTIVRDGVRELVRQALVYDTAAARLTDTDKDLLTQEIKLARQDLINRAGGSLGKLHEQLAQDNLTLDGVLADHRKRLIVEMHLLERTQRSVYVSRKMLWEYYRANEAKFASPKRVAMQVIVVDARELATKARDTSAAGLERARAEAKKHIQDAQAELEAGASFDDVAKQYATYSTDARAADGGRWPLMFQGSYRLSKVEAAAFDLPLGQTSEIIADGDCMAIVRAARIEPGGKISFENAQADIEKTLRDEQYNVLQETYFLDLIKTAYMPQNVEFEPRCVQHAVEKYWRK